MTNVKIGDFVELDYTGLLTEEKVLFDTTLAEVARKHNIHDEKITYKPAILCLGAGHLPRGLDANLEGKEPGKDYTFFLEPEQAFGKRSAKLIQLMSTTRFYAERINPIPGLRVNVDGVMGIVKTVTGGRTLVDFNHPYAGKRVTYEVRINRIVTSDEEKLKALTQIAGIADASFELAEGKLTLHHLEDGNAKERLAAEITKLIPSIKEVNFQS